MHSDRARLKLVVSFAYVVLTLAASGLRSSQANAVGTRADRVAKRIRPRLQNDLAELGMTWGSPVFLRIFKQESVLELYVQRKDASDYALFRSYPICAYSGGLGPKTKEGDEQAPEGFYNVSLGRLNPVSSYHLAMNLGYPNAYDRFHKRTGDFLMVHGDCVSIGCYAMTDDGIDEIYSLVDAALRNGQASVPVHAMPLRFTRGWKNRIGDDVALKKWIPFWSNLAEGDAAFNKTHIPPSISVVDGKYVVMA